ncbi:hypothetical protein CG723_04405 [Streptomyces sp. CB01635]|uniref:DUF4291 family protein n=1 Tax=unclassified Streptomyces TaxID=2593676 RepID=UPI000C27DC43|nr:DUF4291 family protein [Streptomyces sp. CB01635]PJN12303.1 hypothetical protein CG723_04405 [Streptomyces sp. CB01635]
MPGDAALPGLAEPSGVPVDGAAPGRDLPDDNGALVQHLTDPHPRPPGIARDDHGRCRSWRAIQVGLSGEAVERYVDRWIVHITDVTDLAHSTHAAVREGRLDDALRELPAERPHPLAEALRERVGADN